MACREMKHQLNCDELTDDNQGEAGLRAEPAASGLTNPATKETHKRFGAKGQK